MALSNVIVQCLSDAEKAQARAVLEKHGDLSESTVYLRGRCDEAEAKALEAQGLMVELLPDRPAMSWLEPTAKPPALMPPLPPAPGSELQALAASSPEYYLMQLAGPLRTAWKKELEALGVTLSRYVPDFAFKVALTDAQKHELEKKPFVQRVLHYGRDATLRRLPKSPLRPGAPERYELKCHHAADLPAIAAALKQDRRATDVEQGRVRIRFSAPEGSPLLDALAHLPQVSVIARYEAPRVSDFVRAAIGADPPQPKKPLRWDGTGQIVGVADVGVDQKHPDLLKSIARVFERVPPEAPDDPAGHGTHVATSIAGSGAASQGKLAGVAKGAKLCVQTIRDRDGKLTGIPLDLGELFQQAYDAGARIHNNSWGTASDALYTIDAFEVDEFVYKHPDFLVVVAAGNNGRQDPADPLGRNAFSSVQSPGSAKNALTVGACCSTRADGPFKGKRWAAYPGGDFGAGVGKEPICGDDTYLAAFSSRGPTDDERVKPDLVAPGTVVLSARSGGSKPNYPLDQYGGKYCYMSGTSMASGIVSGAAAILRQYFVEEKKHAPSAALLRAALINASSWIDRNTAADETIGVPNFHQGFGRLDLARVMPLAFADVDRASKEAVNKSEAPRAKWRRTVQVGAGAPLSITLAWTDRPGHGLQQDLDLILQTPDGKKIAGNPRLQRAAWAKTDHRNNVEQIRIAKPAAGEYTVFVLPYNTPFEDQGFSLVLTGDLKSDLKP